MQETCGQPHARTNTLKDQIGKDKESDWEKNNYLWPISLCLYVNDPEINPGILRPSLNPGQEALK